MGDVVQLNAPRGFGLRLGKPGLVDQARIVRSYMAPSEWARWCRERGLTIYGMPGYQFAGERPQGPLPCGYEDEWRGPPLAGVLEPVHRGASALHPAEEVRQCT